MFLRREDFVTPRPRESTVHDTVGVYKSTKCHIEIILETKVGNESYGTRNLWYLNQGYNCHLAKRYEKKKSLSVDMGHSRNSKSYNCKIKVLRAICN